jgi:hypothetical protein
MEKQTKFATEDYKPQGTENSVNASSLDEIGVEFMYENIDEQIGKFKKFYVVSGKKDGKDFELVFSSKKLANLLRTNAPVFVGQMLKISGRGEGINRQYDVTLNLPTR